jgi:putative ABC transport system substrate-binding protein
MRRREVIALIGGAPAWPFCASAQQPEKTRLVAVVMPLTEGDREAEERKRVFERTLAGLGWAIGRNLRIDYRSATTNADRSRHAAEITALAPDVIMTVGSATVAPILQATRTIPVVFVNVADPVGAGFVESLGRPGGNATGFITYEYSVSGKWLELLKEAAPNVTRAMVLRDATLASGIGQFSAIQAVAHSFGVELIPLGVLDAERIEQGVTAFARMPNGGLIVTAGGTAVQRGVIIGLAARHKLPAIYPFRYYVQDGGLISYGPDTHDPIRQAATYVHRILKGEKPADLPVQVPTKYALAVNLRTAKALGLTIPSSLLTRADEVID